MTNYRSGRSSEGKGMASYKTTGGQEGASDWGSKRGVHGSEWKKSGAYTPEHFPGYKCASHSRVLMDKAHTHKATENSSAGRKAEDYVRMKGTHGVTKGQENHPFMHSEKIYGRCKAKNTLHETTGGVKTKQSQYKA